MRISVLLSAVAVMALCGCGGGSKSPDPAAVLAPGVAETAAFHVDVPTGKVTVVSGAGGASRAVFAGASVGMTSSVLLDQPGNTGRKVLQVSLTNRTGEPIGQMPDGAVTGVKVTFGDIMIPSTPSDLRSRTVVSTLAGTYGASGADGPVAQASVGTPYGMVFGDNGALYFADGRNRIRKLAGGVLSTVAGSSSPSSIDGVGLAATFCLPYGIAFNPVDHSLVVVEGMGNCVRRIDASGRVTHIAGTGATGDADGAGSVATFRTPMGVAVDAAGTIYVSEYNGSRIRRIARVGSDPASPASYTVSLLAGSAAAATGAVDAVGGDARFNHPVGLTLDDRGVLYVADRANNRIRRVQPTGEVTTIAGTGALGYIDGTGATAAFREPYGVAWVDGALVVSDLAGQTLRQVRSIDPTDPSPVSPSSWTVQLLAGAPLAAGTVDGSGFLARFSNPAFLAASGNGQVVVGDVSNMRIRSVRPASGFFPVGALPGAVSPPASPVRLWNADGEAPTSGRPFVRYAGALAPGAVSAARAWEFVVPAGVQAFEFTVRVEADTAYGAPVQSGTNVGSQDVLVGTEVGSFMVAETRDGPANRALLNTPNDVACDAAGNLYVLQTGPCAVRRLGRDGIVSTILGAGYPGASSAGIMAPPTPVGLTGIAAAPDGKALYLCDYLANSVLRLTLEGSNPSDSASWSLCRIAGDAGNTPGHDNGAGSVARFYGPMHCVWDDAARALYLTEALGNRVRMLQHLGGNARTDANWKASLVAGDDSTTYGETGVTAGRGGLARFNSPVGIAQDASGGLYVADAFNNRIVKIDRSNTTIVLAGQALLPGTTDGPGVSARFDSPFAVTVDRAGTVYVGDGNRLVRSVSPTGVVGTVAGVAYAGVPFDGTGNACGFLAIKGICVDASGSLHVVDGLSQTVRLIQRVIQPSGP